MSPGHASRGSPSSLVLRTARNSRRGRQSPATPDARARLAAVRCVVRGTECPSKAFAPLRGHRKHRTSIVRAPVHRAATEAAPCPIVSSDSSATIASARAIRWDSRVRTRHPRLPPVSGPAIGVIRLAGNRAALRSIAYQGSRGSPAPMFETRIGLVGRPRPPRPQRPPVSPSH
jgi:hypothetical protein